MGATSFTRACVGVLDGAEVREASGTARGCFAGSSVIRMIPSALATMSETPTVSFATFASVTPPTCFWATACAPPSTASVVAAPPARRRASAAATRSRSLAVAS
jgi:hypothetical protein